MADKKISEFPVFSGTQDNQTYYIIASGESNNPDADNYKMPFTDLAEDISSRMLLVSGLSGVFDHITSGASGVFTNIISGATGSFTEELLLDGKPIVTENAEGGVDLGSTEKPPEGVDAPPVNLLHAGEEKISMDDDIIKIGGSSNDPNDKVEIINSTVIKETLTVADGKETILGGNTTVKETLTVADGKETILGGNTTVKETLTVADGKSTTLGGPTTIKGTTSLSESLTVADGKQTILGGATTIKETLTVADGKSTTLGGPTTIKGTTSLSESLTVADGKQTILGGATTIKGAATFNSTASFKSAADVTIGGTSLESILAAASSEANDLSSSVTWANVPDANITKSSVVQHLKWADISGIPSTFPPSSHAHTIADITGLQTALNGKASSSHAHTIADITGLQTALNGKASSSHAHTIADITGLQTALNAAGSSNVSAINDLSDVTISSVAKDDILYYNGSKWVNDAPSEPAFISDKKYKDQISPISSPLSKVNSIKGANFTWSNEAPSDLRGKKDVGVIAQDIQKVLPEAVELRENGDLIVKYHRIIPLLIESIKELDKENKDLKRRLAKIEEL